MKSKEDIKTMAIEAIDKRKEEIYAIGDSIYNEPELGYKEFKTADKVKKLFDKLDIDYQDELAITGIKGKIKGRTSKYNVAVLAELDSVIAPEHPQADKETGAAHCCGHNAMVAALAAIAYAFKDTGVMEYLDGDLTLMAVPAEEYVEIGYRSSLIDQGKINFLGGKQEFIKLGAFDDVDIAIMQHLFSNPQEYSAAASQSMNGFIGQDIRYRGKEAHAGGAPENGINALYAANIGLAAVNANRETFKDEDRIRVHPIISKGGDIVNTIPADVRIESYVRGANVKAILDACEKVTRSWKAGALALGADLEINSQPGYLPHLPDENLIDIIFENLKYVLGEDEVVRSLEHSTASSDIGDVSNLLPTVQIPMGGARGGFHSKDYQLVNRDLAYLAGAKVMAMTVIDLLYDGGQAAREVVENFQPNYSKEEYLQEWGQVGKRFK